MRHRNRESLLRPVDLKPIKTEIKTLIKTIKNTIKPTINTQMTEHSKYRLVEMINVHLKNI